MMETRSFSLTVLSPVHVGCGETISPEDYIHVDDKLVRVNLTEILRHLSSGDRDRVERALDIGDLRAVRATVARYAEDKRFHRYSVDIGKSSQEDLRDLFNDPNRPRKGEVTLLPRNPYDNHPYIPGSSIKGALRTAILNHVVNNRGEAEQARIHQHIKGYYTNEMPERHAASELENFAFSRQQNEMEWDPFRAVSIADVRLHPSTTRIDRAEVRYKDDKNQQTRGIQMHYERFRSYADGNNPAHAQLEITMNTSAMEGTGGRRLWSFLPEGTDCWHYLLNACNTFYVGRLKAELSTFHNLKSRSQISPTWLRAPKGSVLLRVGRFSHFDSLSVDYLRRGFNVQKNLPILGLGATRTLCHLANDTAPAPFGWVALRPS